MKAVIKTNSYGRQYIDQMETKEAIEKFLEGFKVWVKVSERFDNTVGSSRFRVILTKPGPSQWTGKSWKRKKVWLESDDEGDIDEDKLLFKVSKLYEHTE